MRTYGSRWRIRLRDRHAREDGLSLIELIVVVVILGALIAIGVPLLASIRSVADQNALTAAAAQGALAVTLAIAEEEGESVEEAAASAGSSDVVTINVGSGTDISRVCVRAENSTGAWAQVGSSSECAGNSWTPLEKGG